MYDRAAIYVDGSFGSEIAARYGLVVARAFESRTTVFSVYENEEEESKVSSSCDRVVLQAANLGVEVDTSLGKGSGPSAVSQILEEIRPQIVFGALRKPEIFSFGLGRNSIPLSLIRDFEGTAILARVVNCGITLNHERIFVPLKGPRETGSDEELVELLSGIASYYEASLTLYSCVEISGKKVYESGELSRLKYRRRSEISSLSDELMGEGIRPKLTVETCELPHKSILDRVSKERQDLMLVEFTKQNMLKVLLRGHDLTNLISGAPCNVLIWKPTIP